MDRHAYYESLKDLAREKRAQHAVDTANFGLAEVRKIYRTEGIRIDYWPLHRKIKAIYMCSNGEPGVAIQKSLPDEPKLFALVHELKHHYRDQEIIGAGVIHCGDYNQNEWIEIGAEVFAAEFIYPEAEFAQDIADVNVEMWKPEEVVRFKRNCKAKVSYRYICKRLERLSIITAGQFDAVKFQKLEESLYGVPYYKRMRRRSP